jgi:hypothetical protein
MERKMKNQKEQKYGSTGRLFTIKKIDFGLGTGN